jgi:hypothetical protein
MDMLMRVLPSSPTTEWKIGATLGANRIETGVSGENASKEKKTMDKSCAVRIGSVSSNSRPP